ncbi:MAG TPA: ribonuclease D [Candidatus Lumbricidophila sp.]|nr:ribonuclease D [Candidatus Lumbricidophila sp.]
MTNYVLVEDDSTFSEAIATLAGGSGPIAVDAERASGFRYSQRAYLIQMYRRDAGTYLFDPVSIGNWAPLQEAIQDDEWVLHAASQDLPCLRELGLVPSRIFDTELAARLLGFPRVGLASVVAELLDVTLAKAHSAEDWSARPLPESWLSYAALDVELLIDLRDRLAEMLDETGKAALAQEEFEATALRMPKQSIADPWRRVSGIHSLRQPRNLAVARELWLARDEYAAHVDVSPGRLIPDASIVVAARVLPRTRRALAEIKEFTGRASRSELDRWWAAIERGLASTDLPPSRIPAEGPPQPRVWADRNPEADARFKFARAEIATLAEQLEMPVENLLTPDYLRRVAWKPPVPTTEESLTMALLDLGARKWQCTAVVPKLLEAFVSAAQSVNDPQPTSS